MPAIRIQAETPINLSDVFTLTFPCLQMTKYFGELVWRSGSLWGNLYCVCKTAGQRENMAERNWGQLWQRASFCKTSVGCKIQISSRISGTTGFSPSEALRPIASKSGLRQPFLTALETWFC